LILATKLQALTNTNACCTLEELWDEKLTPTPNNLEPEFDDEYDIDAPWEDSRDEAVPDITNLALKDYLALNNTLAAIDIPIFIIECRAARTEGNFSFRQPLSTDLSRSYSHPDPPEIQTTLRDYCNKLNTDIDDHKQDQIICATAIGSKIRFWKKVAEFPQLHAWSVVLDITKTQNFEVVEFKLEEVKETGWDFVMEFI
jgi:hypothetical protein